MPRHNEVGIEFLHGCGKKKNKPLPLSSFGGNFFWTGARIQILICKKSGRVERRNEFA
jgi:hypothetical protein